VTSPQPSRRRLPNRRVSETLGLELNGHAYIVTTSNFGDGKLAEIFMSNKKRGGDVDTNARDAAIILSFALQHGADVEAIRHALCRDSRGRPQGPIGAALDLLAGLKSV